MAGHTVVHLMREQDYRISCKLVLHPHNPNYAPGDPVEGRVIVTHSKERLMIRGLRVLLHGTSFVRFTELGDVQDKTDSFLGDGTAFTLYRPGVGEAEAAGIRNRSAYVFGGGEWSRPLINLPPGTHSYTFVVRVPVPPPQLPSSFKSQYGRIFYKVLALVDVAIGWELIKAEKTINVLGCLEIGPEPPIKFEKVSRGFGPCPRYSFRMPTSGFVTGRDMEFEMRADNCPAPAQQPLKGTVTLVLKITYHGLGSALGLGRSWKDTYTVINEISNDAVGACWKGVLPISPQLQITYKSSTIEFHYLLRVRLESEKDILFKFERTVKVGTCKEGEGPVTETAAQSGSEHQLNVPSRSSGRRGTSGSLPRYSMLSLLRAKSKSFETLPPPYDEVMERTQNLDISEGIPRSSSHLTLNET